MAEDGEYGTCKGPNISRKRHWLFREEVDLGWAEDGRCVGVVSGCLRGHEGLPKVAEEDASVGEGNQLAAFPEPDWDDCVSRYVPHVAKRFTVDSDDGLELWWVVFGDLIGDEIVLKVQEDVACVEVFT